MRPRGYGKQVRRPSERGGERSCLPGRPRRSKILLMPFIPKPSRPSPLRCGAVPCNYFLENGTTVRADRGLRPLRLLPLSDSLTEGRTKGKRRQQRRASQVSAIRQASCLLAWSKRWALGCANSPPWPENARRGITQHLVRLFATLVADNSGWWTPNFTH